MWSIFLQLAPQPPTVKLAIAVSSNGTASSVTESSRQTRNTLRIASPWRLGRSTAAVCQYAMAASVNRLRPCFTRPSELEREREREREMPTRPHPETESRKDSMGADIIPPLTVLTSLNTQTAVHQSFGDSASSLEDCVGPASPS